MMDSIKGIVKNFLIVYALFIVLGVNPKKTCRRRYYLQHQHAVQRINGSSVVSKAATSRTASIKITKIVTRKSALAKRRNTRNTKKEKVFAIHSPATRLTKVLWI